VIQGAREEGGGGLWCSFLRLTDEPRGLTVRGLSRNPGRRNCCHARSSSRLP